MTEYTRPGHYSRKYEDELDKAESITWTLLCDIEYYLSEVNSKQVVPTKHALDMMLKHIHHELWDIRQLMLKYENLNTKAEKE